MLFFWCFFFFQAEDGIRDLVRSRGLGDVYKRQILSNDNAGKCVVIKEATSYERRRVTGQGEEAFSGCHEICLLYTSDAADERSSVDLGGRRIIKKINKI